MQDALAMQWNVVLINYCCCVSTHPLYQRREEINDFLTNHQAKWCIAQVTRVMKGVIGWHVNAIR